MLNLFADVKVLAAGIALSLAVALGIALVVQSKRLELCQTQFREFRTQVATNAAVAKMRAEIQTKNDVAVKEKADEDYRRTTDALRADIKRLRDLRPAGSGLPAASAGSSRPDLACFDRAEYLRADGEFVEAARRLADEGTANAVGLDTAKEWELNRRGN